MDILTKAENKMDSGIDEQVELVNSSYDEKQRQLIFSLAWKIVCADGKIENHEKRFASQLRNRLELSREQAELAKT